MQPLFDGDVLLYEVGFAAEAGWQSAGFPSFDYVAELLDQRIANTCAIVEATAPPIFFFTGKTDFRTEIAKTFPYKQRPSLKPFHYKNIRAYIKGKYDWREQEGLEADDLMAIEQTRRPEETIICTRDKDLRSVPGWHYGWELGNQPQFGPELVTETGYVKLSNDRRSLRGVGMLFFYGQCLTGDKVDTIPGLDGCGPVKAFQILDGCLTTQDAFKRVLEAYRGLLGPLAEERLLEQGRLLWMTRELNEDGSPVLWVFPNLEMEESGQKLNIEPSSKEGSEVCLSDGPQDTNVLTQPNEERE
jgi:hypothetical protein